MTPIGWIVWIIIVVVSCVFLIAARLNYLADARIADKIDAILADMKKRGLL